MRGGGIHFGGHRNGPRFAMPRAGGPRGHIGRSFRTPGAHIAGHGRIDRRALRGQAFNRADIRQGASARALSRAAMRQELRSAPVHARNAPNAFAARTFSGRNAQALAARALAGGRRFDPAFSNRVRFAGAFWPGPYFWPYAYYDQTFWLWPSAYDAVFWSYGYDDLLYGIYRPYGYDFGTAFGQRARPARAAPPASGNLAEWCGSTAPGLTDWPVDDIVAAVEPTPQQRMLLDDLIRVSDQAAQDLRAACPRTVSVTPIGRLEALQQQLAAMGRAVHAVRPALEKFYASLSDEQKERFNELGPQSSMARRRARAEPQTDRLARACSEESDRARWPTARIGEVVQPNESQRAALDELRAAIEKAAETVRAACPTGTALTPTGRLAAMEQRIAALQDALETLRPALTKFYASLTDEQKSRFNRTLIGDSRAG